MEQNTSEYEPFWKREARLKKRKSIYKETYKKGVIFENTDKLIEWLKQNDILIRVNAAGKMDDETEFIQITIEGFKP